MKINHLILLLVGILLTVFAAGCIETDDTRGFYISPEGKVDVVINLDNVRSSDKEGADKALKDWLHDFKSGKSLELKKLKETGAHGIESFLIRKNPPFAALVRASYDSVEKFGQFLDLNRPNDEGTLKFEKNGTTRRLVFQIKDVGKKTKGAQAAGDTRTYYPLWKFVPEDGTITEARGFILSEDKRSCLLNLPLLERMKKTGEGYTFSIAWDVSK